jgi:arabinofuranosyltransferase
MSGVFLIALAVVVHAPGWLGSKSRWRRYLLPLTIALAVPALYEIWRMAYFAMLVANTALAKSAGSSWWSQGIYYLWNFVVPYALWIPLLLVLPLTLPRITRWWNQGDRVGVVVLLTPAAAGLVDTLYVLHVGGDYMHARLLLPAFLSLCLGLFVTTSQLRTSLVVAVVGIAAWSLVCAGWLRFVSTSLESNFHGIDNERNVWIDVTGNQNPITTSEWGPLTDAGDRYRAVADVAMRHNNQDVLVVTNQLSPVVEQDLRIGKSPLPFHLVINLENIGSIALAAGPEVYIFDTLSLANPIGSHTTVAVRGRPGHEKVISPVWMIARFGLPGEHFPMTDASPRSINAARKALGCQPLASYLHAITVPLSWTQAVSNIAHSLTFTTMSFSPNPIAAERQLCS